MSDEHLCYNDKECNTCRTGKSPYEWSSLAEKAYCICLADRKDRLHESMQQFHNVGLCSNLVYYRPQKDTSTHVARPGTRGCWESHRQLFIRGRKAGYNRILVFEDDVIFDTKRFDANTIKRIHSFVTRRKDWEIFFLGHMQWFALPSTTFRINRVFSSLMHAYIIRLDSKFADWFIQTPYDALLKDRQLGPLADIWAGGKHPPGHDCYAVYFSKSYAIFPQFAFQSGSATSNPKNLTFFGSVQDFGYNTIGLKTTQKFAEIFTSGIFLTLVIIIIVLIIKLCKRTKITAQQQ